MKRSNGKPAPTPAPIRRCAIYTRKSTEEGLEQEFNSLDAQREAGEAYVKSQQHEGWTCSPTRYDDGGFTGGNMDRPALRRLMADIEAGTVNCVVVYKVDRLSRSLLDFARMMQAFEEHAVSFVSVTQQFNTATSMGRLVLNVLLSFAQFEREIISERTRDKIAATRRKGKWAGGHPVLGYDVDPQGFKLTVNTAEANRVRTIFEFYLEYGALLPVVQELNRRGWRGKFWSTRKGASRGGKPFTRSSLHALLTNVVYLGKVKYKAEVHAGEHAAIVTPEVWQRVQALLQRNGRMGGAAVRNTSGALLKGLLRCTACGTTMSPSHTTRKGRRYRYYVCSGAQKRGWQTCPAKSVPAAAIEEVVVDHIRAVGRDAGLRDDVMAQVRRQDAEAAAATTAECKDLNSDLATWHRELQTLTASLASVFDSAALARLTDVQERIAAAERRLLELRQGLPSPSLDPAQAAATLAAFEPVWATLTPREQARVLHLLIERVDYDGARGWLSIAFRSTGIRTLAQEWAESPGATR